MNSFTKIQNTKKKKNINAQITWIDGSENVLTAGEYVKEPSPDLRLFTAKSILKLKASKEYNNKTIHCQAQNSADKTYRSTSIRLEVCMHILSTFHFLSMCFHFFFFLDYFGVSLFVDFV